MHMYIYIYMKKKKQIYYSNCGEALHDCRGAPPLINPKLRLSLQRPHDLGVIAGGTHDVVLEEGIQVYVAVLLRH